MAGKAHRTVKLTTIHKNVTTRILSALVVVSVLLLSFSVYVPVHADTGSNWTGAYFNNQTLSGSPVFNRIDPALVFNWGPYGPGPGIGGEHWS